MKNSVRRIASASVLLASLLLTLPVYAAKLSVDPAHSTINFEATHLKVSKIPGRFLEFSGTIDLDDKDITQSKIDFTVQTASISTSVPKRDDHLKSADFFDVIKYPLATFKSVSIKKVGSKLVLAGYFTIHGVTKKTSFDVKSLGKVQDPVMKVEKTVFSAVGKINRKDFGVNYGPNEIVSDNIDLTINLETLVAK